MTMGMPLEVGIVLSPLPPPTIAACLAESGRRGERAWVWGADRGLENNPLTPTLSPRRPVSVRSLCSQAGGEGAGKPDANVERCAP
jgi:hypothetical protein